MARKDNEKKLWGGRFQKSTSQILEKISSSIDYDQRLYHQDIKGSIAHARMLTKMNILTGPELNKIITELKKIEKEITSGTLTFDSTYEDIHMSLEAELTKRIGNPGKKLHTARSRNDQITLDTRRYLLDEGASVKNLLLKLITTITTLAEKNIEVVLPGYTHLQIAQPVRFSQHLLAYTWSFLRDLKRLEAALETADYLPLGSGALAGVNYKNDRLFLKKELGFKNITLNSMDAVSDRDYILDFLYFSSVLGMHLSRFCEELILWSSAEFNYIKLADAVTTGSSIMPQKKNPDIAELIRGKTGRLYGNLISLLTTLKSLPMTYNRDLQEDKEPLFDSLDTIKLALPGMIAMLTNLELNKDNMAQACFKNFSTATDLADYLVTQGVPFREAHKIVGQIVLECETKQKDFFNLSLKDLKTFSSSFSEEIKDLLNPLTSPERKKSMGSTAKKEIIRQIKNIKKILNLNN